MADEIPAGYEDLFEEKQPTAKPMQIASVFNDVPPGYEDLFEGEEPEPRVSKTGLTSEPMPQWQQGYKALNDRLTIGGGSITRGAAGLSTVFGMSFEDAQKYVETDALNKAQKDTEDYVNENGYFDFWKMRTVPPGTQAVEGQPPDADGFKISGADLPGWLIEQIPQLGVTGVGAATGAGVGAIFGSLPGAAIGAAIGAYVPTAFLSAGNHIYELQSRGVDKHTATVAGSFVGAITGTLEMIGLKGLIGAAPDAAVAVMKSQGFKDGLRAIWGSLLHSMGTEMTTEYIESLTESTSKIITAKLNNKVQPVTSFEVLNDAVRSAVQAAVVSSQIGASTTGLGAHAGLVAKAIQEKIDAATAEELKVQAQLLLDEQAKQRQADAAQDAEIDKNTKQGQARARKQLRGFAEVRANVDLDDAQAAVQDAQAALDNATADDKPVAQLALKQAKAELQQAQYQAQVDKLEEALTDPDLLTTVREHKEQINDAIGKVKQMIEDANLDPDIDAAHIKKLKKRLSRLQEALKETEDFENLGSEEKVKEEVTRRKEKVKEKAAQSRKEVAQAQLERRIAERGKTVAQLKAEIRADKKAARESGEEADTDARRTRLEQLNEQQQIDSLLLQMFAEDAVTVDDIKDLSAKVPAARLTGLVKVAGKQIEQAAKFAGKEQKKFTASAKRLLDGVIDLARLPQKDKDALSAALLKQDLAAVTKALPKLEADIKAQFDERRLQAAHTDLKRARKLKIDKEAFSKFPGVEEVLLKFNEFIDNFDKVAEFEDYFMLASEVTDIEEAIFHLTPLLPVPVEQMTAKQIEALIDNIVALKEKGKSEALRTITERQTRQQKKLNTFRSRISATERGQKRLDAVHRQVSKFLDNILNSQAESWRGLMTIVSQFGEMHDMADILDLKAALDKAEDMRLNWEKRFADIVHEHGISSGAWHKLLVTGHKQGEKLTYLYAPPEQREGEIVDTVQTLQHTNKKPLTLWEMVQVRNYLLDEDPDAISRLSFGNKFSYPGEVEKGSSTLEQIETYLNDAMPGWRPAADALRQFYREFHDVVDEASYRRFGRHITKNETYGGELLSSSEPGARFRERFRRFTTKPKSLKARKGGERPVLIRGAIDNLNNHIAQYSRELNLIEFEQDVQAIFKDRDVETFIRSEIGDVTMDSINKTIEDVVVGYNNSHAVVDKVANWLRESMYTTFLAARPEQFAKQATSVLYALQFVNPQEMIEGWEYMLANPEKANELMSKSGLYRARLEQRQNYKQGLPNDLRRFNGSLMMGVKAGDTFGVRGAAFPVLLKVLKETGSEEKAIKAFNIAFDTTQSSGSIDEQPILFRHGAMAKLFTALTQQPTRNVEDIATAWRKWRSTGKAADYKQFLRTVGVMYLGAFMYQAMGYMVLFPFMSDEDREKKLAYVFDISLLGPFSGVAVFGNLLAFCTVASMKLIFNQKTRAWEPEMLPTNPLGHMAQWFDKLIKIGTPSGDAWSLIRQAARSIGGVTGLPADTILKDIEPLIGAKK